ncbi:MAG TPA: endonuclease/exonuclease/phosphatase family protein, partial [bacterium]|nr:endonuclease/exonuclease/phosphatase family protein [bacterium]
MTYNLLTFNSGSVRVPHFKIVLQYAQPDVLVAQELGSQAAVDYFLNSVLNSVNPGEWAAATFTDVTDDDNALFYRTAKVQVLSHLDIETPTGRQIDEWRIRPVGYASAEAEMRMYVAHLSPNQGGSAPHHRLSEVTAMRARMETFPAGQNYVVCGDLNLYDSDEPAYQYMLSTGDGQAGVVSDPIDTPGDWHDQQEFAPVHTQSTRLPSVGGGSGGGMDDRFDFILRSPALKDHQGLDLLESTYTALGEDGLHFNISITDPPDNAVVPQEIAQALYSASDHIPVFADFQLPAIIVAGAALDFGVVLTGGLVTRDLSMANAAASPADDLDYTFAVAPPFGAPGGSFEVESGAPANIHAITLLSPNPGTFAEDLVISSDDPDDPKHVVALTGQVWQHAQPSVVEESLLTVAALDFGTHASGEF